ncbi:MAG: transposase [Desulfobacterales bacterium]|nr:transposase [Desulfobacterales bacterium]
MGTASPSRELILRQKASILVHLEEHLQEMTKHLDRALSGQPWSSDVQILTSIRGIGNKTAASFLIEMGGEIQKFENAQQVDCHGRARSFGLSVRSSTKGTAGSPSGATGISEGSSG